MLHNTIHVIHMSYSFTIQVSKLVERVDCRWYSFTVYRCATTRFYFGYHGKSLLTSTSLLITHWGLLLKRCLKISGIVDYGYFIFDGGQCFFLSWHACKCFNQDQFINQIWVKYFWNIYYFLMPCEKFVLIQK